MRPGNKEGFRLLNHKQPGEIQITPVHQVDRPRFEHQGIHHIDLVRLAVSDANETGDNLDVAQRLAVGQLGEGHGEELVQTREVLDLVFAVVLGHTAAKCAQRQIEHELR